MGFRQLSLMSQVKHNVRDNLSPRVLARSWASLMGPVLSTVSQCSGLPVQHVSTIIDDLITVLAEEPPHHVTRRQYLLLSLVNPQRASLTGRQPPFP